MNTSNIGIVLVTFNRLETLKKCIACYEKQTRLPAYIVVVDNCSTDGSVEYLKEWEHEPHPFKARVMYLSENSGGAGGFYEGLKAAQEDSSADWIWVADDDGFPEKNCLEKAHSFLEEYKTQLPWISAFCGMCVDKGRPASVQRSRIVKFLGIEQDMPVTQKAFRTGKPFSIDLYSFVGTILKRESLLAAGLPRKDFFIYQDDYEHAVRMGKIGKIYCVPQIVIHHKDNYNVSRTASWRDYYATRNIVILYKEHLNTASLYVRILRRLLVAYLSFNRQKIQIIKDAIADGLKGKTGLHEVYRPG